MDNPFRNFVGTFIIGLELVLPPFGEVATSGVHSDISCGREQTHLVAMRPNVTLGPTTSSCIRREFGLWLGP